VLFILGVSICPAVFASTNVSGHITEDTTWDLSGSPYSVTGSLTIDSGVTLTLSPGVFIEVGGYDRKIVIDGRLEATDAVIRLFYMYLPQGTGSIEVRNGGQLSVSGGTIMERGWISVATGGQADLSNVTFVNINGPVSLSYSEGSSGSINNCTGEWDLTIRDSDVAVASGIELSGLNLYVPISICDATISGSLWAYASATISNSQMEAIRISDGAAPTVTGCTFTSSNPITMADPDIDLSGFSGNTYPAGAAIIIYGTLDNSKVLSFVGTIGKYSLTILTISDTATLTLSPGVFIEVGGYDRKIVIDGRLEATDAVIRLFYMYLPQGTGSIEVRNGGQLSVSGGTIMERGWISVATGGQADLSNVTFVNINGPVSLSYSEGSSGSINNCTGEWDLTIRDSDVAIVWCNLDGVYVDSCNPSIFGNNFFGSAHLYVTGDPTSIVTAENNWWGSTDPAVIETKITHHADDPARPWVDYEPFRPHPIGTNVIYLDFTSYTAPVGCGTTEEVASYVKNSVISKFAAENVLFATSFDGPVEDPGLTTQVYFIGTNPYPNILGSANTDPGNNNWTDIGYVYTDQALFSTMPTNATEYRNMLTNVTAHEIGHLLGYDHSHAAGMPFMKDGYAMQTQILQGLLLGELGETQQQRWTYIVDTNLDLTLAKPEITYVQGTTMSSEQLQAMLDELEKEHGYTVEISLGEVGEVMVCTLADIAAIYYGYPTDAFCLAVQNQRHPDYVDMVFGTIRVKLGETIEALNIAAPNDVVIEPTWDADREMYMFFFDCTTIADFNNLAITVSFISPFASSNNLEFTLFDPNYEVIGQKYVELANISPYGDINGDGKTNFKDFAIWANHTGEFGTYLDRREGTDLNRDEYVDERDLFSLTRNWLWQASRPDE
jgi:hypothetical protein